MSTDLLSGVAGISSIPNPGVTASNGNDPLVALSGNYSMFLKLLTTQLQNQDPLNPTDATTYTQQLVSYSQVEQQIKTNSQINSLIEATKANNNSSAGLLNYLGHYVKVDGGNFALQDGTAHMSYELTSAASNVAVEIYDSTGKKVAGYQGAGGSGLKKLSWDGIDNNGDQLPDGLYSIKINATDVDGNPIGVKNQASYGKVTGIEKSASGNLLFIGNTSVDEGKVTNIYDSLDDLA